VKTIDTKPAPRADRVGIALGIRACLAGQRRDPAATATKRAHQLEGGPCL